jgi:hypothetical protein
MSRELHAKLSLWAHTHYSDALAQAYLNRQFSEEIDKLASKALYSGSETKERKEMAAYILCRPQPRRASQEQKMGYPSILFRSCILAILAIFALVLALESAHAQSMTLEELMAMDNATYEQIQKGIAQRRLLERECDCTIVNGVKIHGYPGAWSARNRRLREDDIDININGSIYHGN